MKEDYKVVLVNTKDPKGMKIMNESSHVVKEVPSDYFKFQNAGQHDYCRVHINGQLADDPAFYFRKRDAKSKRQGDNFTDPSVFVNINIIATTETYHDRYTGELRQVSSNVSARSFLEYDKRALSLLHKGDRISVTGDLKTYQSKDRQKTWFYIKIKTFTVNPYKTISNMASDAFDVHEPARRTNDIISDYRISNEEKKSQLEYTNIQKDKQLAEQEEELNRLRKQLAIEQKEKELAVLRKEKNNNATDNYDGSENLEVNEDRAKAKYDHEGQYYQNNSMQPDSNNEPKVPYDKIELLNNNNQSLEDNILPENQEESFDSGEIQSCKLERPREQSFTNNMNSDNNDSSENKIDSFINRTQIRNALSDF